MTLTEAGIAEVAAAHATCRHLFVHPAPQDMARAAIVVLAGNESHADQGRLANALEAANEFAETGGNDVKLIFGGAGVRWVTALENPDGDYHHLCEAVREHAAVCYFCASAFHIEAPSTIPC